MLFIIHSLIAGLTNPRRFALAAAVAASFCTGSLCAAVIVESNYFRAGFDTNPGTNDNSAAVTSFTIDVADIAAQSFSAAGNDKLVAAISVKAADNAGGQIAQVTYDSIDLTEAIQEVHSRSRHAIFYLDDVTSDGDLVINLATPTEGYAVQLFALDNTVPGVAYTAENAGSNTSPELTSTYDGAFFLYQASRNFGSLSDADASAFDSDYLSYTDRGRSLVLWDTLSPAGTYSTTISGMNSTGGFVGAVFQVPEPASFALIGLGGLALFRRRR